MAIAAAYSSQHSSFTETTLTSWRIERLVAVWASPFMVCGWCWNFHFLILFIYLPEKYVIDAHETDMD
jgi:hypothetical protein